MRIIPGDLNKWKEAAQRQLLPENRQRWKEFARRHFFLVGAVALIPVMLLVGGLRLLAPSGAAQSGGGGAGGRATAVTAVAATNQPFTSSIEALGNAKGAQSVNLTSNQTELITAVHFQDGAYVRTGQVLVDLKSTEERADTAQAQAALDVAQSNYNRYDRLARAGFLSPAAMDQNRATLRQAQAGVAAARSRQADRVIRAPFSGRIGLTDIAPGTLISPGTTIATLDDLSTVRVDFNVPDRYLASLRVGTPIDARPDPYPDRVVHGRIALIDSRIDPDTHAIRARADFSNADGSLVPGMLMHIAIDTGQRTGVAVPESAVQTEGDQTFVYVIAHQGQRTIAQQTPVETGEDANGYIEITRGITAGTQVVRDGLSRVEPGAAVRVGGATGAGVRGGNRAGGARRS